MEEVTDELDDLFPFPEYRPKQRATLKAAYDALQDPQFDNIVIDAPTGVGKSPINVALCRSQDSAFYTTPQKKLREQLERDADLSKHYQVLKAREDYRCGVTGENCKECSVNLDPSIDCTEMSQCTYWDAKQRAVSSDIAVTTFAYLIIDGDIPERKENGQPASFGDRDVVVVDECHALTSQVANLHAGFSIGPWSLPGEVYDGATKGRDFSDVQKHQDVEDMAARVESRAKEFLADKRGIEELHFDLKQCRNYIKKYSWFRHEVDGLDRQWVVDVSEVMSRDKKRDDVPKLTFKPVYVDNFLKEYVWSRGENRILSTATKPYRGRNERWCRDLGLDSSRTKVIRVGMPIDKERRKVHTGEIIGEFSGGGDKENWESIMESLNELAGMHEGEKGLIHTASYSRARDIVESVAGDEARYDNLAGNVKLHRGNDGMSDEVFINDWQSGKEDIALSPSMAEGVDLVDDMCRWQVLVKVPYPYAGEARTNHLINEKNQWGWYYEMTGMRVVQSAGRAVRGLDDRAEYYVLDGSFEKVRNRISFPDWFEDAIVT